MLSRVARCSSRASAITPSFKAVAAVTSQRRDFARKAEKPPVRVAVTGAAGQIGYALLFRLCSGQMLGPDQPLIIQGLELTPALNALKGVAMELQDCAFPLVRGIVQTDDPNKAFEGADFALLVGARPRTKGMERGDLLKANAEIFKIQGKALNAVANRDTIRVVVVGNPANTNALIASHYAPDIPDNRFSAMTKLDHNRGLAQLAEKTGCRVTDIERFVIWGNHSATQYPSIQHATIGGRPASQVVNDNEWLVNKFIPDVQQRGAAIIAARGASSAGSAASSAIDHTRELALGTGGRWTSMAVVSNGEYGVEKGLYYSFPVICEGNGQYKIVEGLKIDDFSKERMLTTEKELKAERDAVF